MPTIYVISGVSQDITRRGFHLTAPVEGGTHTFSELNAALPTIYVISGVSQDIARRHFHLAAPGGRRHTYAL